jgi:hypothetical protein
MYHFIPREGSDFQRPLKGGVGALTRSMLVTRLLDEAKKSSPTRQQLDTIERHIAELRKLTYRQLELIETDKSKGYNVELALEQLKVLNDLMANYQMLRRRIDAGIL